MSRHAIVADERLDAAALANLTGLMDDLRRTRTEARRTQASVAAAAGISQSVVSAAESGTERPSLIATCAIASALGRELVLAPIGARATQRASRDVRERLVDAVTSALSATDPTEIDRALVRVAAATQRWHHDITTTTESYTP